jgi:chromosome partitioning protein
MMKKLGGLVKRNGRWVVAFVNQKGGCGKTTLAVSFAALLARQGASVVVVDADPQAAALSWSERAGDEGLGVPVVHLPTKHLTKRLDALSADVIVIDGPAGEAELTGAAIRAADFVVVPMVASGLDMWMTEATIEAIRAIDRPAVIVPNLIKSRRSLTDEIGEAFGTFGLPVLEVRLKDLVEHVKATLAASTIWQYAPSSEAAKQVEAMAREIVVVAHG